MICREIKETFFSLHTQTKEKMEALYIVVLCFVAFCEANPPAIFLNENNANPAMELPGFSSPAGFLEPLFENMMESSSPLIQTIDPSQVKTKTKVQRKGKVLYTEI